MSLACFFLFLLGTELESLQLTASKFALTARDPHESLDCLFWPEPFLSAIDLPPRTASNACASKARCQSQGRSGPAVQ